MTDVRKPTGEGLAHERTVLAWYRSGLAAVVCIGVLIRNVWPLSSGGQLLALVLAAAAAIVWAVALVALAMSGQDREDHAPARRRVLWLMTAGTVTLAAVAFVLAFFAPP